MQWIRVTAAENIPLREGRAIRAGNLSLAVFNTVHGFLAVENRCPHSGGPLSDGIVGGTTVTCPLHNWRICLESGMVTKPCADGAPQVRRFPVEVRDGIIVVDMEAVEVDAAQAAA
jgi:nitrite reductase (NADH) small subunit